MSDTKVLALLKKDFGFLGTMCGVPFNDLKGAADRLYSFMSNLETELVNSAGTLEGQTPKSGAMVRVCDAFNKEPYQAMGYGEGMVGLENLTKTKNAYVLTSLMLGVSSAGLDAQSKQDQEVYNNLKEFLTKLSKGMNAVLEDVSRSRVALLAWNMMGSLHKNSVMTKMHEDIVKRKKAAYTSMKSVLPQLVDNSFSKESQSGGAGTIVRPVSIEQLILEENLRRLGKKGRKRSRSRRSARARSRRSSRTRSRRKQASSSSRTRSARSRRRK